jgi:hypothetical protein
LAAHPDEFAAQVNYLAAIGRMVVPRAFSYAGRKILFVGHVPFNAEELASLLPDEVEWHQSGYAPAGFVPDLVVLGRDDYTEHSLRSVLGQLEGSPKILPQEGFVDELLFGHDWWDEEVGSLQTLLDQHQGLQVARSAGVLAPLGIGPPPSPATSGTRASGSSPHEPSSGADPVAPSGRDDRQPSPAVSDAAFPWPSNEAEETRGGSDAELDLRARSRLNELGYSTNVHPSARWRILTTAAVPELGLPKVAGMIAWFCRSRKQQRGGRQKYARAIGQWEHDLDRLKRELYPGHRPWFAWPRSEP